MTLKSKVINGGKNVVATFADCGWYFVNNLTQTEKLCINLDVMRNVAILIFDEVEVLDFCGPFEVFSVTGRRGDTIPFEVYTVAENSKPVLASNNLSVNPRFTIHDCPKPDILLIPGGYGTRREMNNQVLLDWIKEKAVDAELILSVCTGSLILAKAGLLEGLAATTHFGAIDLLREIAPNTTVQPDKRFIDNGRIIISAGVSAGIDMSFYVVGKLLGKDLAMETARYIEYDLKESIFTFVN